MSRLTVLSVIAVVATYFLAQPLAAKTISVEGQSTVEITPEFVTLSGAVTQISKASPAAAQQRVDAVINGLLATIEALPADPESIEAGQLRVQPRYRWNSTAETQELVGYEATREFSFRLLDLDSVGEALQALSQAGTTRLDGPIYGSSKVDTARAEALGQAYARALADARVLASASGLSLGAPETISTGNTGGPIFPLMGRVATEAMSADPSPRYEPGLLQVTASVSVIFSTRP